MHRTSSDPGIAVVQAQLRRSLDRRASRAGRAIGHLDDALTILRTLDDDIYWNVAAAACDAADDLQGWLDRLADEGDIGRGVNIGQARLTVHRTAVAAMRAPQYRDSASVSSAT